MMILQFFFHDRRQINSEGDVTDNDTGNHNDNGNDHNNDHENDHDSYSTLHIPIQVRGMSGPSTCCAATLEGQL